MTQGHFTKERRRQIFQGVIIAWSVTWRAGWAQEGRSPQPGAGSLAVESYEVGGTVPGIR